MYLIRIIYNLFFFLKKKQLEKRKQYTGEPWDLKYVNHIFFSTSAHAYNIVNSYTCYFYFRVNLRYFLVHDILVNSRISPGTDYFKIDAIYYSVLTRKQEHNVELIILKSI